MISSIRKSGTDELKWSWKMATIVLVAVALAAGVIPLVHRKTSLPVYVQAAERIVAGQQIYRPDDPPAFTYPPFFVLPFIVLVWIPAALHAHLWCFTNLVLLAAILWLVTALVWPVATRGVRAGGPPLWLNTLVIAVLAGRFVVSPLEYQSHDLIVLLLILLASWALVRDRGPWAGGWAGLAAACKATPLLFLPYLCWQRRFVATMAFIITMIAATLLPDVLYPSNDGQLWVRSWYERFVSKVDVGATAQAEGAWGSWNALNQSLAGTMYRLSTPDPQGAHTMDVAIWHLEGQALRWATLAIELALIAYMAWVMWPARLKGMSRHERSFHLTGHVGMLICAMLLLSPMSSSQHFVGLLVPVTYCVTYWMYVRRDAIVGVALAGLLLVGPAGAQDLTGAGWADVLQAYGAATWATLICLLASGRVARQASSAKRLGDGQPGVAARHDRAAERRAA